MVHEMKLCTCVKHLQLLELKAYMLFLWISFLMTMISSRRSPIFDGSGLLTEGLCSLKQQMFHDTWLCIILWLCCTCQWVATWLWQMALTEEDILYLCIRLCFGLILKPNTRIIDIHLSHIRPLCTHMKHCTLMMVTHRMQFVLWQTYSPKILNNTNNNYTF